MNDLTRFQSMLREMIESTLPEQPFVTVYLDQNDGELVGVKRRCPGCGGRSMIYGTQAHWEAYADGAYVQNVWPEASKAHREMVITGYHDACFNALTADHEDG